MTVRFYSSVALQTSLTAGITASTTTIQVASTTGFPGSTPFLLALDYGAANEELVDVTTVAGLSLTVTRNVDGTSASTHNSGAIVRHVSSGRDFSDSRNHENASTNVHGLAVGSAVVGTTDSQTLTNKSLTRATGTLQNVNLFNVGGAFTTSVIGDSTNPSVSRFQVLQNEITLQAMAIFDSAGGLFSFPLSGASDNNFRWRSFDPDGVTERSALRQSGSFSVSPNATTSSPNLWVRDDSNSTTKAAIAVTNLAGSTGYFQVARDGHTVISPPGGAGSLNIMTIQATNPAFTGNLEAWVGPTGSTVANMTETGTLQWNGAAWTSYTPTWTSGGTQPAVGNGTLIGRYTKYGRVVHGMVNLIAGSTTTFGTGGYSFALPFQVANVGATHVGTMHVLQGATPTRWTGHMIISPNATAGSLFATTATGNCTLAAMSATAPATLASGDQIRVSFTYESIS